MLHFPITPPLFCLPLRFANHTFLALTAFPHQTPHAPLSHPPPPFVTASPVPCIGRTSCPSPPPACRSSPSRTARSPRGSRPRAARRRGRSHCNPACRIQCGQAAHTHTCTPGFGARFRGVHPGGGPGQKTTHPLRKNHPGGSWPENHPPTPKKPPREEKACGGVVEGVDSLSRKKGNELGAVGLLWAPSTMMDCFQGQGNVSPQPCVSLNLTL
jgi:hypothetical protein